MEVFPGDDLSPVRAVDCWDGTDGEPVVTHGYALTSKLIFREVLKDAILPNAFAFSEYPLILSLENHCTSEQQKRLAFHITDVFGGEAQAREREPSAKSAGCKLKVGLRLLQTCCTWSRSPRTWRRCRRRSSSSGAS